MKREIDTNLNELEFSIIKTALEAKLLEWKIKRDTAVAFKLDAYKYAVEMELINNILRKFNLQ